MESSREEAGAMWAALVVVMAIGELFSTAENGWTSRAWNPGVLALATLLATVVCLADSHCALCDATWKR
jgi:hypothetical protein